MPKPKRPTLAQMTRAKNWGAEWLRLQDWTFTLTYNDEFPHWEDEDDGSPAAVLCDKYRRHADIHIRPGECEGQNHGIIESLFHELVHVRLLKAAYEVEDMLHKEWLANDFAAIMRKAYHK